MLHFKWSIYEVEFNKFIMKQKKIKEMAIKPLKQKQLTALALAFAACSFLGEQVEYELYTFKKGEGAATFTEELSVGLYWPEGLYLHLAMCKQDYTYGIFQKYLPMIANYCASDDPDILEDDEQFYYDFRLSDNLDDTSYYDKLLDLCPKIVGAGSFE